MNTHNYTFKEWIIQFIDTNTPFSDLAKDIKQDNNFPDCSDKSVLMSYIETQSTNTNVHRALSEAIDLYLDEL